MKHYPNFIKIGDKKYKINTDFRLALKCDEIARSGDIGEYEKTLAIIYILLGDDGLEDSENHIEMIKLLVKYLQCGKQVDEINFDKEPSMDFEQDTGFIKASFMSDYQIDLDKVEMHWWAFYDLLQGLTENSVLNRVRSIREEPLTDKKGKELRKWQEMKKAVELKKKKTQKEIELDKFWEEQFERK